MLPEGLECNMDKKEGFPHGENPRAAEQHGSMRNLQARTSWIVMGMPLDMLVHGTARLDLALLVYYLAPRFDFGSVRPVVKLRLSTRHVCAAKSGILVGQ